MPVLAKDVLLSLLVGGCYLILALVLALPAWIATVLPLGTSAFFLGSLTERRRRAERRRALHDLRERAARLPDFASWGALRGEDGGERLVVAHRHHHQPTLREDLDHQAIYRDALDQHGEVAAPHCE